MDHKEIELYPDEYEFWPNVDEVLEHFGVKGMHWGVRKAEPVSSGRPSSTAHKPVARPSEDSKEFEKSLDKIDRGGIQALSTKELQKVVNRMNLEQQYDRLISPENRNYLDEGNNVTKKILGYGKTMNDVYKFTKSPLGKFLMKATGLDKQTEKATKAAKAFKVAAMAAKAAKKAGKAASKTNPVGVALALTK